MADPPAAPTPAPVTPARLDLGRSGAGLPTRAVLAFALDHARARDAVHAAFDIAPLQAAAERQGLSLIEAASAAAASRETYLRRPDLGRRLADPEALAATRGCDVLLIAGDGLSATAVTAHVPPLLDTLLPLLEDLALGPLVVAHGARVALADEIGERLSAKLVVMLIGERPGLSSPDSLGAYITYGPAIGRTDSERNCVSNIRPQGLPPESAAPRIAWLIREALRRQLTGVALKDASDTSSIFLR